ncbi:pentapeptide repeat-containing protein [Saccharothrix saharensis]|uniref:pentapeptide repeat-containing protein n=1 Tax=Saccharothrix saharensis TaxID=571190 RepID=UPI0036D109F9
MAEMRGTQGRSSLSGWAVLAAVVGMLGAAGLVLAVLWGWSAMPGLGAKDAAGTRLEAVKIAASVAVAGGGLFALYLAARRQRTQELELAHRQEELAHSTHDATERRVTELYSKAVEQLGSDKAVVRQGGLYALERVAQDNPAHRQTVINVICAYLRAPFTPPPDLPATHRTGMPRSLRGTPPARVATAATAARRAHLTPSRPVITAEDLRQEREVRLTAQRILAAHLRSNQDHDDQPVDPRYWPEGYDLDLAAATLIDFDMTGCRVDTASFTGATFVGGTNFDDATFTGIVRFDGTTFTGHVGFHRAKLTGTVGFDGATFTGTTRFDDAKFTGTIWFEDVIFTSIAGFSDAEFTGTTRFDRATFTGITGLERATFTGLTRFDDVICNGIIVFDNTRFTGETWLSDSMFKSATGAADVWVRVDPPDKYRRTTQQSWPTGWTVDWSTSETRKGWDGKWARLVPVPAVFPPLQTELPDRSGSVSDLFIKRSSRRVRQRRAGRAAERT